VSGNDLPADRASVHALYVELVQREIASELAKELLRRALRTAGRGADAEAIRQELRLAIAGMIPAGAGVKLPETGQQRIALIGPPGSGKTTTLCKLAAQFKVRAAAAVGILSLDNQRLASGEPLRRYAGLLQIPYVFSQSSEQVRAGLETLSDCRIILIDTPGIGPRDALRLERVTAMLSTAQADETHVVLPASSASTALKRASAILAPLKPTRLILTRLDEAIGLGTILNVIDQLECKLSYITDGQRVPTDLREASADLLADLVLQAGHSAG
jgi:flagellar biosynthesis protein FlhF